MKLWAKILFAIMVILILSMGGMIYFLSTNVSSASLTKITAAGTVVPEMRIFKSTLQYKDTDGEWKPIAQLEDIYEDYVLAEPEPVISSSPSPIPTTTLSPTPTVEPTETPEPTETAQPTPTNKATPKPTAKAKTTPKPTATATPAPTEIPDNGGGGDTGGGTPGGGDTGGGTPGGGTGDGEDVGGEFSGDYD